MDGALPFPQRAHYCSISTNAMAIDDTFELPLCPGQTGARTCKASTRPICPSQEMLDAVPASCMHCHAARSLRRSCSLPPRQLEDINMSREVWLLLSESCLLFGPTFDRHYPSILPLLETMPTRRIPRATLTASSMTFERRQHQTNHPIRSA